MFLMLSKLILSYRYRYSSLDHLRIDDQTYSILQNLARKNSYDSVWSEVSVTSSELFDWLESATTCWDPTRLSLNLVWVINFIVEGPAQNYQTVGI